jgi:hypothetical protein
MNKFASRLRKPAVIVFSFAAGYLFYHYSVTIWDPVYQGWELTNGQVERLRQEAIPFFYRTMGELFEGTYDPNDGYVGKHAVVQFHKYRSRLEPRCRLINVYFYDAAFDSEVLFPSGDRFAVPMIKGEKGWRLDSFDHLGSAPIYHDLWPDDKGDLKP